MRRSNPPWSDKILKTHWAALERRVGPELMPKPLTVNREYERALKDIEEYSKYDEEWAKTSVADAERRAAKFKDKKPKGWKEYGSGHYGVVMPTNRPGTVIKVTTDLSEATFVAAYLSLPRQERPVGIIPYHKIVAIRSESHHKRPVFVLWREEAQYLGESGLHAWVRSTPENQQDYYRRSLKKSLNCLNNCLQAARSVRALTNKKPNARELLMKGVDMMDDAFALNFVPSATPRNTTLRIGWFLNVFNQNAGEMQSEPMGQYVGQALEECLRLGILLADVHHNNIGMPTGKLAEEIGMTPIITDPGHALALNDQFDKLHVEDV